VGTRRGQSVAGAGFAAWPVVTHGERHNAAGAFNQDRIAHTLRVSRANAVRDGPSAEQDYLRLLDACEALGAAVGMPNLLAGANMARHEAYRHLVARGFCTEIQGVAMHKQNDPGYCRPGAHIIDDWR
jgi:hypothetical protein